MCVCVCVCVSVSLCIQELSFKDEVLFTTKKELKQPKLVHLW